MHMKTFGSSMVFLASWILFWTRRACVEIRIPPSPPSPLVLSALGGCYQRFHQSSRFATSSVQELPCLELQLLRPGNTTSHNAPPGMGPIWTHGTDMEKQSRSWDQLRPLPFIEECNAIGSNFQSIPHKAQHWIANSWNSFSPRFQNCESVGLD